MRALARTAGVLLVAVRINQLHPGRAISDYEIADILEVDKRTVQKQLRSLSAAGLMLEQRPGKYVVTAAGQNTLLSWSDQPQIAETASLSIEEQPVYSDAQNVHAQNVQFMIDDDDIKNLNPDSSSSINPESTKCAQILDATQVLFGESVSTACLSEIAHPKPTWVLAWVNKAWRDRERLTNPHGLIYRRVISCERPPLWLEKDPTAGLPEEFLEAIGMLEKVCPRCHEKFTILAEHTAHVEKCLMTHFEEPEEELAAGPDETVTEQVRQSWQTVLDQLRNEMPKAQFQTWVEDAHPVHFGGTVLQVGVRNGYAKHWLTTNLSEQAGRLVSKTFNATVCLEWIVSAETE
jgi:DNA-binding transcriptional regulator YhcF (GntR family)